MIAAALHSLEDLQALVAKSTAEVQQMSALMRDAREYIDATKELLTLIAGSYNPRTNFVYIDTATVYRMHLLVSGKVVRTTGRQVGHAHETIWGTCSSDVTSEDIERLYFHPYFGGREVKVADGQFSVVRHND